MSGLTLTRRVGEVILIGDDIRIVLCSAEHGKAAIKIEAPREVAIDREELRARKMENAA